MTKAFNRESETSLRKTLRSDMPPAERILWAKLRLKQLGVRFRRQFSVGPYCVDFYCPAAKVAVEIDGPSHFEDGVQVRDEKRQHFIEQFGIRFLRFINTDVYENLEGVLEVIGAAVGDPPASPLGKGGREGDARVEGGRGVAEGDPAQEGCPSSLPLTKGEPEGVGSPRRFKE